MLKRKLVLACVILCLISGIITSTIFLNGVYDDGIRISGAPYDYSTTGQVGDFIGGVVGTLFALSGTFLIYLTFQEQTKQNKREAFEAAFFEMLRLHRENVNELTYTKYLKTGFEKGERRKVFKIIFEEFIECYREVKKFSNSKNPDDYLTTKYKSELLEITKRINNKINIIELAIIDISYCIVFFGLNIEGEAILRHRFKSRYNGDYFYRLLSYIKLKPKAENKNELTLWEAARNFNLKDLRVLIDELYIHRSYISKPLNLSDFAIAIRRNYDFDKYYGGHQHRLGHYFRHLYQSYNYINNHSYLNWKQKYFYGKTLRAQLSTYEQSLIFINSISSLGFKWELNPKVDKESDFQDRKLISKFNLIKNLHGQHILGIKYREYYPEVSYETED